MQGLCSKMIQMSLICSKSMSYTSRIYNEIQICRKILYFNGIINDITECIVSIVTVNGHSVYSLYLRKPAADSWGLLAGDPH